MRSLAKELAPHNVRVNTVHPTNVDTLMIQNPLVRGKFRPDLENPTREEFAAAAMTMNMLAIPWIEPVDVANAALFLSSDEASLHHVGRPAGGCGKFVPLRFRTAEILNS